LFYNVAGTSPVAGTVGKDRQVPKKRDDAEIEMWVAEQVGEDDETTTFGLHAHQSDTQTAGGLTILKKVSVKQAEIQQKITEMGNFITGMLEGWSHSRVRLDEVSFSLEVASDGVVRWVLGAGIKGTASIKFKIDPIKTDQTRPDPEPLRCPAM
jgi:hypothetical protein